MEGYVTESQQLAELKKQWDKYGNKIAAVCLIAAVSLLGWRYFQQYKTEKAEQASMLYSTLLEAATTGDNAGVQHASNQLARQYGSTPYAGWTSLITAKQAVDQGKLADAAAMLQTLANTQGKTIPGDLARIRLARIQLAQNKPDAALKTLDGITQKTFVGVVQQVRGDAFNQQQNAKEARAAYNAALAVLPPTSINYQIVRMQRDELVDAPATSAPDHKTGVTS
jgi:predicted negative regulator of RcsB-dependent stress response